MAAARQHLEGMNPDNIQVRPHREMRAQHQPRHGWTPLGIAKVQQIAEDLLTRANTPAVAEHSELLQNPAESLGHSAEGPSAA